MSEAVGVPESELRPVLVECIECGKKVDIRVLLATETMAVRYYIKPHRGFLWLYQCSGSYHTVSKKEIKSTSEKEKGRIGA